MTTTPEAYVHLSEDQKTLTFYYDTLRADRDGTKWGIRDTKDDYGNPAWTANSASPNTTIRTAVFDASFHDFRPTTTARWFKNLQWLESIKGFEHLNTSQVTDMRGMFKGCRYLTALDLSKCPKLEMIACINNGLTKLDVTMCSKLSVLYCYRNKLTELKLRGCGWLTELSCGKNYLPNLDFSGCNSLRTAYCCDNDFSYAATEELYRSLPDRTTEEEPGHIFILNEDALPAGRTGAGNEGIATKKHWEVLWCRGDW